MIPQAQAQPQLQVQQQQQPRRIQINNQPGKEAQEVSNTIFPAVAGLGAASQPIFLVAGITGATTYIATLAAFAGMYVTICVIHRATIPEADRDLRDYIPSNLKSRRIKTIVSSIAYFSLASITLCLSVYTAFTPAMASWVNQSWGDNALRSLIPMMVPTLW